MSYFFMYNENTVHKWFLNPMKVFKIVNQFYV